MENDGKNKDPIDEDLVVKIQIPSGKAKKFQTFFERGMKPFLRRLVRFTDSPSASILLIALFVAFIGSVFLHLRLTSSLLFIVAVILAMILVLRRKRNKSETD